MPELDELAVARDVSVPTTARLRAALATEKGVMATAAQLERLEKVKDFVNSEALESLPEKAPKLMALAGLQGEQTAEAAELGHRAAALVQQYNEIVATLNQKFVYWDELLTAAEAKVAARAGEPQ